MPVRILHPNHIEIVGTGYVLLTSPHTTGPVELYPGQLVEDVALTSRAYAIIGKNSPAHDDERKQLALQVVRDRINDVIGENGIKCVLEIHAKKELGVDIQTNQRMSCTEETSSLTRALLSKTFQVTIDQQPEASQNQGSASLAKKSLDGIFELQLVHITVGLQELETGRDKLIEQLAELVGLLNVRLGFDPAREPVVED